MNQLCREFPRSEHAPLRWLQRSPFKEISLAPTLTKLSMRTGVTLLTFIFPVVLILLARWSEIDINMGISGTYDVLAVALLLPQSQVLALLPPHVRGDSADAHSLISPTLEEMQALVGVEALRSTRATSAEAVHPVFIQLGHQHATGPGPDWLPKMSFGEAKVEIPYVRHPALRQHASTKKRDAPFVFKQTM
jgi:hypothetical protein